MKLRTALIILTTLIFSNINLFSEDSKTGIYGGIVFKPSLFSNDITYFSGARVGIILNHQLAVGLSLYSMTFKNYKSSYFDEVIEDNPNLEYNYYGLETEYFFNPENQLYGSFHLFAGRGRANLSIYESNVPDEIDYTPAYTNVGYFTVIEPEFNIYLALRDYYRLSAGVGYRMALNADLQFNEIGISMDNSTLSGPYIHFSIIFGRF